MIVQLGFTPLSTTLGSRKSLFNAPSKLIKSCIKRCVWYSSFLNPISKCLSFILISNQIICSFISVLLRSCTPTNIVRFVIAVIVNSINLVFFAWRQTNIFKKCFKRIAPFFAYSDPSTAPQMIVSVFGPVASSNHVLPCYINFRSFFIRSMAVFEGISQPFFFCKATTAFGIFCSQAIRRNRGMPTAIANAQPRITSATTCRFITFANHGKASESLACQVDVSHVDHYITSAIIGKYKTGDKR